MKPQKLLLLHSILYTLLFISLETKSTIFAMRNNSIPAIFVFGDSTVDPGNNNYIETIFKSDFPPYGREFPNQNPTGRFTNGRLVTDYIGSYLGIKEFIPAYLDPTLGTKDLTTGVSFASAGSGLDPLTAQLSNVIQIADQLKYFREYKIKLEKKIGKERSLTLFKKAAFIISVATNDFIITYFGTQHRQHEFTVTGYQEFLFQQLLRLIKGLRDEGANKIAVVGLPPMGCLPAVITLNYIDSLHGRSCIESFNSVARDYNSFLQQHFLSMKNYGAEITYVDIYTPLIDIIQNHKFGFDVVNEGCCGSGLIEAAFLCNMNSLVCPDASKYVFWDSIHPTQNAYYAVFKFLIPTINRFINLK